MTTSVLRSIEIRNLACFGELRLQPGLTTLLVGRNGAGKSTLLDVFLHLNDLVNGTSRSPSRFPDFQVSDLASATVKLLLAQSDGGTTRYLLELEQPPGHRELSMGHVGPAWSIVREEVSSGDEEPYARLNNGVFSSAGISGSVPVVSDRSPLSTVQLPPDSPVGHLKRWLDAVWLLRLEPRRMVGRSSRGAAHLDVSGENFASWLRFHAEEVPGVCAQVVDSMDGSVDGLASLDFLPLGRDVVLVARFADGRSIDFDALSDGQRVLIVLHAVMELAGRSCRLLLLDEPDAHITPEEIGPVFSRVRALAVLRGLQVIVASHHPSVIDILAPDSPWELQARDGVVQALPLEFPRDEGLAASRYLVLRGRQ